VIVATGDGEMWSEFANAGGPSVMALVVVGGLVWRAVSPLLQKLLGSLDTISENLKDMTTEIGKTNTEIRAMAVRLDMLEREVRDPHHHAAEESSGSHP
jgi:hypothetical protein